jgi:hypothetical protein
MASIERKTKCYPTDLTDAEWSTLAPFLPKPVKRGRRPSVGMREIVNAIRYMTRGGVCLADYVEAHLQGPGGVTVARLLGELDPVVGQDRVDLVRHGLQQVFEEFPSCSPVSLINQLGDGKFACSINGDEQVKLAFAGLYLGDVQVEKARSQRCNASPAAQGIG